MKLLYAPIMFIFCTIPLNIPYTPWKWLAPRGRWRRVLSNSVGKSHVRRPRCTEWWWWGGRGLESRPWRRYTRWELRWVERGGLDCCWLGGIRRRDRLGILSSGSGLVRDGHWLRETGDVWLLGGLCGLDRGRVVQTSWRMSWTR